MRNSAPLRFHQALNLKKFAASGDPIAVVASPWLRPIYAVAPSPQRGPSRCESARVQPFKCSQQVMPATRKVPQQSLFFRKRRRPRRPSSVKP